MAKIFGNRLNNTYENMPRNGGSGSDNDILKAIIMKTEVQMEQQQTRMKNRDKGIVRPSHKRSAASRFLSKIIKPFESRKAKIYGRKPKNR